MMRALAIFKNPSSALESSVLGELHWWVDSKSACGQDLSEFLL